MKRLIGLLVIIAMLVTSIGFSLELDGGNEDERQAAEEMAALGIFRGDGVSLNLDQALKREELMLLIARLQGQELQALTMNKRPVFEDIVDPWWEPVIAWAYDAGITKGVSADRFGFGEPVTLTQMELFLLRVLGEDPSVEEAHARALERGLLNGLETHETFSRGMTAVMLKNVLNAVPAGESETLRMLLGLGEAIAADAVLEIRSVMQTGERELTIELNRGLVDEELKLTRRGMEVGIEEIQATDQLLVVTTTLPLFETKYGIQIGQATASFVPGEKAEPVKLEILTDDFAKVAYNTDTVWVEYRLLDQYGNEIDDEAVLSKISWLASPLAAVSDNEDGRLSISNTSDREWVENETVIVLQGILRLDETAVVATKQGVIEGVQGAEQIEIGDLANLLGEETAFLQDTEEDDEHFYALPVTVGETEWPVLAAYVAGEDGVMNTEDDGLLLSAKTNGNAEASWVLDPENEDLAVIHVTPNGYPEEETLRVTVVDRFSGAYGYNEVKIGKVSTLETFVFFAPEELVTVGEVVELPFEAYDQYGMRILDYPTLILNVQLDPGMPTLRFEEDETTQAVHLIYRPTEAGMQTLRATANGKTQSLEIRVYEESRPVRIAGLAEDVRNWMTENAEITLSRHDFLIYDQYNNRVDLSDGYAIQVMETDSDEEAVSASGTTISGTGTITFAKDEVFGAKEYTARIAGEGYKAYAFTMNSVDVADLDGFAIEPIGILYDYSRKLPLTDAYPKETTDYRSEVKVYGQYMGREVALWADAGNSGSDLREVSVSGPVELVRLGDQAYVQASQLDEEGTPEQATLYATFNYGIYTDEAQSRVFVTDANCQPASLEIGKDEEDALDRSERFDEATNELIIKLDHFAGWDGKAVYRNGSDRIDVLYFQVADQYGVLSQFDPVHYTLYYEDVDDRTAISIGASSGILSIDESRLRRGDRFRIQAEAEGGQTADLTIELR